MYRIATPIGLLIAMAIAASLMSASSRADSTGLERFYGLYEGTAISDTAGEISKRDIKVEIKPHEDGFTVNWVAVSHKPSGGTKRREYSINFRPSSRKHIFAAAMRTNLFGKRIPLDPLKGDPYVWGKVVGPTLTVYAMLITDDGGYEVQTYIRTLTDDGMELQFKREHDGISLRTVTGTLKRVH